MSHAFTNSLMHIVFSTKRRQPCIDESWRSQLHQYLGGTVRGMESVALEVGGVADHVHLLVSLHPKYSLSDFLRGLKSSTSKWVNESGFIHSRFEWQRGYGAFSVSQSQMEKVRQYIQNQESHHHRMTFEEEFAVFLKAHGIPYDERYIFD